LVVEASPDRKRLLVVAGEESGDLYGGLLASALREAAPGYHLVGMGGDRMQRAGVDIRHHIRHTAVTGLVEVAARLRELWRIYGSLLSLAQEERPAAAVLIDFPDFNLRLAKKLKSLGIPVVYFVGPSIWAWRPGRLETIVSCVQKMLVILPFEEPLYRSAGVDVEYCGHPLLDLVKADLSSQEFRTKYGLEPGVSTVCLCPGSRPNEIRHILPVLLDAVAALRRIRKLNVVLPVAPSLAAASVQGMIRSRGAEVRLIEGDTYNTMKNADFLIVASGTATVEAGLLGKPMVSVYRMAPFTFHVGVRFVKIKEYCMVNLLLQKKVVPELIQGDCNPARVREEALRYLDHKELGDAMSRELLRLRELLGPEGSAGRLARSVVRFLEDRSGRPGGEAGA
jgi:lipid-A-disaccharide synthase